jgi:hypothetical protein
MPTRSQTKYVDTKWALQFQASQNGKKYPDWASYQNTSKATLSQTRTDSGPVKGYKFVISKGWNATSDLYGEKQSFEYSHGHIGMGSHITPNTDKTWEWAFAYGNTCHGVPVPIGSVAALTTTAQNEAKRRFISRCYEAQSAFNSGQFLGELREALHMVRHPAQALRRGVDDYFESLRKRRKGNLNHRKKILADSWLEYQFGWASLISDINSASEQLRRIRFGRPPIQEVSASYTHRHSTTMTTTNEGVGGLNVIVNTKKEQTSVVKIYGKVTVDLPPGSYLSPASLGFRWDQFVPTVWELIPYSFLVDYFTNIGDIIQSWSYARSNLIWSSMTTIRDYSEERRGGKSFWSGSVFS